MAVRIGGGEQRMGVLEARSTKQLHTLAARSLIGRHAACDIRVDSPLVSTEHASLLWTGDGWALKDLGSRNGTFLDGARLGAGQRAALAEGATFAVGERGLAFTLVDAAPPIAGARQLATGHTRRAEGGLLVLPRDEDPRVSVFQDALGQWVIESEEAKRPAVDRDVVTVAGEAWVLELPGAVSGTWQAEAAAPTLETIDLRLGVSRDEEHVEVIVVHQGSTTPLPSRRYHYLLVILARERLSERDASPAESGWIDREALCKKLGVDTNRLNVDVFRLRKQLADLGIQGISGLVARRPDTGQIRLGTDRVEVTLL
jgi:hypothetical protein